MMQMIASTIADLPYRPAENDQLMPKAADIREQETITGGAGKGVSTPFCSIYTLPDVKVDF